MDKIIATVTRGASEVNSYQAFKFSSHFKRLTKALDGKINADLLTLYKTIRGVCEFHFQPKETVPFAPMWMMQGKRSIIPDDLSADQLDHLAALTDKDLPAALMARLCDVLWIRRKDHVRARKALDAYLECAEKGVEEHWPNAAECALRAVKIANELGRKAKEREVVKTKLLELFKAAAASPSKDEKQHWPHALAQVLIEGCDADDCAEIGSKCQALGDTMGDAWTKESYYQIAAEAFGKAGLPDRRKDALRLLGQTWEDDASKFRTPEGGEGMQIAFRLENAINAFRQAGERDKAEQLLKDFQKANKLTIDQMKSVRVRVDVDMTKFFKEVEQRMMGKLGMQAVEAFIEIHRPEIYATAYQAAKADAQTPSIRKVVASTSLVDEGNIASRSAGGIEASESDLLQELVGRYALNHSVAAVLLEHARSILLGDDTRAWAEAINDLVRQSAFVPVDRQEIYGRGIVAGLDGDLLLFTHLIIPQIEHSVRQLVGQAGGKTTSYRDGLMKERDLNQLLTEKDAGRDAYAVLGEDLTWELRASLVEQSGPNIRNRVCHGLATIVECESPAAKYLLWLVLYLIARFEKGAQIQEGDSSE